MLLAAGDQAVAATQLREDIERVASQDKIAFAIGAVEEPAPFGEGDDDDAGGRAELVSRNATVRPFLLTLTGVVPFGAARIEPPACEPRRPGLLSRAARVLTRSRRSAPP